MTLDDIDISNLVWVDQYDYSPVEQEAERSLTGGLIVQEGTKVYGQPITLSLSWLPKSTIDTLKTKEAQTGLVMLLTLDNASTHSVVFNRTKGTAVSAKPVFNHTNAPDDWNYETTIRLFTVEPIA